MVDLPRLGLACALTPNKDEWSLKLTPVSVKSGEPEAIIGETKILDLHNPKDHLLALQTMFETIDKIIQEKHKGKVKVAFGIDRRSSLSDHIKDKLNPFITNIQALVSQSLEIKDKFDDRVEQLADLIKELFKKQETSSQEYFHLETRSYGTLDAIEENLVKLPKDSEINETPEKSLQTYIRSFMAALIPIDQMLSISFHKEYPNQPRFIALTPIKSPDHKRFERARQAIAQNQDGARDEIIDRLVKHAKFQKPFALKFFGIDSQSAPYADVVAGMLYEDEAKENPNIREKKFGAVYIPES